MEAYTLWQTRRLPNRDEDVSDLRSDSESEAPALSVETQETLAGDRIVSGKAYVTVETTEQDVIVGEGDGGVWIDSERVDSHDQTLTDYVAVPAEGIVGVARSGAATSVCTLVARDWATDAPVPVQLDLDGFVAEFRDDDDAVVNMVTAAEWSDDQDPEEDRPDCSTVDWGEPASLETDRERRLSGVGFAFDSVADWVRGVAFRSGYLALNNVDNPETYLRFVREHVGDHLDVDGGSEEARQQEMADIVEEAGL